MHWNTDYPGNIEQTQMEEIFYDFLETAKEFVKRVEQVKTSDMAGIFKITDQQRLSALMAAVAELNETLKEERDNLIRLAINFGISQRAIAKDLKISTTTVNKASKYKADAAAEAEITEALANEKPLYQLKSPDEKDDGKEKDGTKNPIRRRPKNRQQSKKN